MLVIGWWCKCAKTGSAGIETRVSVFSQLTHSVQKVNNERGLLSCLLLVAPAPGLSILEPPATATIEKLKLKIKEFTVLIFF